MSGNMIWGCCCGLFLICSFGMTSACDLQSIYRQYNVCLENLQGDLDSEPDLVFTLGEYDVGKMDRLCGGASNFVNCTTPLLEGCPQTSEVTRMRRQTQNAKQLRMYICEIVRTEVLGRSRCWVSLAVQEGLAQCLANHSPLDINDVTQLCSTMQEHLYCMEFVISKHCGERSAVIYKTLATYAFLIQFWSYDCPRLEFYLAKSRTTFFRKPIKIYVQCVCPIA